MSSLLSSPNNSIFNQNIRLYFEKGFIDLVEDHRLYLLSQTDNSTVAVSPLEIEQFGFRIMELFKRKRINEKAWSMIMVMNGIIDNQSYPSGLTQLIIPSSDSIEYLRQLYKRQKN